MTRQQLAPAVHLNLLPMNKFKTDQVAISFIMPLDARTASYATLLSMVLKTGCAAYPDVISLGRVLDELYGAKLNVMLRKKGDSHLMTFCLEFLAPAFVPEKDLTERALELLRKILFEPLLEDGAFSVSTVAREKKNLCDMIDGRINDKRLYALRRCGELTAQGQPYEVYECGDKGIVEQINATSLYEFYLDYMRRAVVEIYGFGRIEAEQIFGIFSPMFDPQREKTLLMTTRIPVGPVREYEENYLVEQAKLSMGFCFDEEVDDVALRLFVILYGGSPSSLLFMNVREKLSLCYYCTAMTEKHKNMMIVYSGVMPEKIEAAKAEILAQLESVKQGRFTQAELTAAKKAYVNSLRSMADSMGQTEDYAISQVLLGKDVDVESVLAKIHTLEAADVQAVAKTVRPVTVYVLKGGENHDQV